MDTAGRTPGPAGRSDHASFSGPSSRTTAETRREAGAPLSGALGAALLAAAALLLAPGDARAAKECGNAPANVHLTCSAASYPDGIFYGGSDTGNWLGGYNTITIAGSSTATTTITAKGSTGSMDPTQAAGVYLRAGVGVPWVSLIMGGETDGTAHAVNVVQGTNTNNAADRNNGVYIQVGYQQTGAATVDLKSGVTIGSAATPMKQNGVFLRFDGDGANWGHLHQRGDDLRRQAGHPGREEPFEHRRGDDDHEQRRHQIGGGGHLPVLRPGQLALPGRPREHLHRRRDDHQLGRHHGVGRG